MHGSNLFSECMVDGDATHRTELRRLRGKAVIVSTVFEMILLAALCLWPLYHLQAISAFHFVTPVLPFRPPSPPPVVLQTAPTLPSTQTSAFTNVLSAPVRIPATVSRSPETSETPEVGIPLASSNEIPPIGAIATPVAPPPPADTTSRKPITKGGEVMAAMLIQRVEPLYPKIAQMMGLSGRVTLLAVIRTDGSVAELTVLDGNPILAQAAKDAVAQWRYRPTFLNGQPVEVQTTVTVNFTIGEK